MRRLRQEPEEFRDWLEQRAGIVHRFDALDAGWRLDTIRSAAARRLVRRLRRNWFATTNADRDLVAAASVTGRITCVTAARHRGWWTPPDIGHEVHIHVDPNGTPAALDDAVIHWTRALTPPLPRTLLSATEDILDHVTRCLPDLEALAVWESAIRIERLSPEALRRVNWVRNGARSTAARAGALSDSGLETVIAHGARELGVPVRQQVSIAGHDVDALVGDRLVLQADGFAHHSSSTERTRDLAHDAELTLRGYTVLRFSYAQIMYDWPSVIRTISRSIAAGAHVRTR